MPYSPGPKWFKGETSYREPENRSGWTAEELHASEVHTAMPEQLRAFWSARRATESAAAYVLLPEAFDVVGDGWRVWSPGEVLEHWSEASPAWRRRKLLVPAETCNCCAVTR